MRNQRKYIEGIVSVAAGHDSVAVEQVPGQNYAPERGFVWDVLRDFGLPHASALEEDLDRAYGGREPIYFAHKWRLADQFRRRLEIPKWSKHPECDRDSGASHVSELVDEFLEDLKSEEPQDPYEMNCHACRHQQKAFYESPEWKRRAKALRAMDQFTCRSCGASDIELHVHHIQPIFSVHSPKFHRNFDVCGMRTLCWRCHVDLHEGVIRHVNDFQSATEEERQEAQKMREKERAMHDQARECVWCQRFRWEGVPEWAPETEAQPTGKDGLPF